MPAFSHKRRCLPQTQRLGVNGCREATRGRQFLAAEGPAEVAGDQRERGLVGQPGQVLRAAPATEDRPGRADHDAAAGKDVEKVADLVRAGRYVINGDDGTGLTQQLRALLRGQLDRTVRAVQPGHKLLKQIPDTVTFRPQIDAARCNAALGRGGGDVLKQGRLAITAGRLESDWAPRTDGSECVGRLPLPAEHQRPRPRLRTLWPEHVSSGLPERRSLYPRPAITGDLYAEIAVKHGAHTPPPHPGGQAGTKPALQISRHCRRCRETFPPARTERAKLRSDTSGCQDAVSGAGLPERGQRRCGTQSRGSGMTAAAALPCDAQIVSTAACSPGGRPSRSISAVSPLTTVTAGHGAYEGASGRRSRIPTCRGRSGALVAVILSTASGGMCTTGPAASRRRTVPAASTSSGGLAVIAPGTRPRCAADSGWDSAPGPGWPAAARSWPGDSRWAGGESGAACSASSLSSIHVQAASRDHAGHSWRGSGGACSTCSTTRRRSGSAVVWRVSKLTTKAATCSQPDCPAGPGGPGGPGDSARAAAARSRA